MKKINSEIIYEKVYKYCKDNGFIAQLRENIATPEAKRFKSKKISQAGLNLLDAVHCLVDKQRTDFFLREIRKNISSTSKVIEAGMGTGVLAFYSATIAEKVYAIEINPLTFKLATKIQQYLEKFKLLSRKPVLFLKDATKAILPEKVDVVINENIYTGIFFEKQVQIMRQMRKFLKKDGVTIPSGLRSYILLADTTTPNQSRNLIVPMHEKEITSLALSKPQEYDFVVFKNNMRNGVRTTLQMPITKTGTINSVLIYSEVLMPSGVVVKRNATEFLNNDIILTLPHTYSVKRGELVKLHIIYPYGADPKDATLKVSIMNS